MNSIRDISTILLKKYKYILYLFIIIVVLTPFITNDAPILCMTDEGLTAPMVQPARYSSMHLSEATCRWAIHPVLPFHSTTLHTDQDLLPPLSGRHLLGTDSLGRDVLAGLLYGLRSSLLIAFISMMIAGFCGTIIGCIAGYFGNYRFKISKTEAILHLCWLFIWIFISGGLTSMYTDNGWGLYLIIFIIWISLHVTVARGFRHRKENLVRIPIDGIIMRLLEIYKSVPSLFILLLILGYVQRSSVILLAAIIGGLTIPSIIRLIRGEVLKISQQDFVTSAIVLNYSHRKILLQQILPNVIAPLSVILSFGAAGAILAESTLSFLGIGLAVEDVTWGSMLAESRRYYRAWWLAIVPGGAIFGLIYLFNHIAETIHGHIGSTSSGL